MSYLHVVGDELVGACDSITRYDRSGVDLLVVVVVVQVGGIGCERCDDSVHVVVKPRLGDTERHVRLVSTRH